MAMTEEMIIRLRKAHGSLMIIAWLLFATIGIIAARYFRRHWLDKRPFGLNIWFLLHRTLNYLGVLLMLAGLICVLASRNWTWSGPGGSSEGKKYETAGAIHSLFGLICIIICWAQPLAALFRCSTTSSKRPIYNWFHRIAGIVGWLLAVTTICIAAANFPLFANNAVALALVIIFLVSLSMAVAVGEISAAQEKRHAFQATHKSSVQRRHTSFSESTFEMKMQKRRSLAFGLFSLVAIAIVIALLLLIMLV